MGRFGTGQAVRRTEDQRFLTGSGRYTDDITLPEQTYLHFFRSPYPHGRISMLETGEAREQPGVIAIYTAQDLSAAGIRDVIGAAMPASSVSDARDALEQPPLARDKVRYVGEPVVAILAESRSAARDAAELVWMDVEELPAVVTVDQASAEGAPRVYDDVVGNSYGVREYGDKSDAEAAFAVAEHTVDIEIINNRLAPTAMEPRGCNIAWDGETMTVYQG